MKKLILLLFFPLILGCEARNNIDNIYQYKKAEDCYQKGLNIDGNNLSLLNNLANLKKNLDQNEEAISIYEKILLIKPEELAIMYNLAGLHNSLGNFEKSKKLYLKMLDLQPNFTEADRMISQMEKYNSQHKHFFRLKENNLANKISKYTFSPTLTKISDKCKSEEVKPKP